MEAGGAVNRHARNMAAYNRLKVSGLLGDGVYVFVNGTLAISCGNLMNPSDVDGLIAYS